MIRVLRGDCREVLKTLPDASVHMCVTSPPYYGLRDYGVVGQIGLEPTPDEYVAQLVAVFREVRRALRDDGTLWLNLGDSYNNFRTSKGPGQAVHGRDRLNGKPAPDSGERGWKGAKEKDLLGIPWMVAFALRADGWYLRQDNIWAKRNCMPESVRDRTTRAHEYVFMLTKSARYFYDAVAIEEQGDIPAGARAAKGSDVRSKIKEVNGRPPEYFEYTGKRNKRSVWWMATQPFPEAHFATFPPELPKICIKAGTSERGCCPHCGAPWERVVETPRVPDEMRNRDNGAKMDFHTRQTGSGQKMQDWRDANPASTIGWRPTCSCPAHTPIPATVLDPFFGAGTTGLVADRLGRNCIGIELNEAYGEMTKRRIEDDAGMFANIV